MVENMFFLDSEHVEMEKCSPAPPLPKKKVVCLFISNAWFKKIILLVMFILLQLLLGM